MNKENNKIIDGGEKEQMEKLKRVEPFSIALYLSLYRTLESFNSVPSKTRV